MSPLQLISAVGLPFAMAIGAIMAWRASRKGNDIESDRPAWRDDSLDEWRRERDVAAEEVRANRGNSETGLVAGAAEEQSETKRHQRIGG